MKNQVFDFDRQVQTFAVQLIGGLSALAPVIIIFAMLGAFAWLGFMDYLYFSSALPSPALAVLAAAFLQSMRFGTALGSVRMFKAGRIAGILFLGASLALTYLESGHVIEQAAQLATTNDAIKANVYLIKIAVWASVGLELLVAVLFNAMFAEISDQGATAQDLKARDQGDQVKEQAPATGDQVAIWSEALAEFSANGNGTGNGKTKKRPL